MTPCHIVPGDGGGPNTNVKEIIRWMRSITTTGINSQGLLDSTSLDNCILCLRGSCTSGFSTPASNYRPFRLCWSNCTFCSKGIVEVAFFAWIVQCCYLLAASWIEYPLGKHLEVNCLSKNVFLHGVTQRKGYACCLLPVVGCCVT